MTSRLLVSLLSLRFRALIRIKAFRYILIEGVFSTLPLKDDWSSETPLSLSFLLVSAKDALYCSGRPLFAFSPWLRDRAPVLMSAFWFRRSPSALFDLFVR